MGDAELRHEVLRRFRRFPRPFPAARKVLTEPFLRSFDGALSAGGGKRPRYRSSPPSGRRRCRKARVSGSRRGTAGSRVVPLHGSRGPARMRRWRRRCCSPPRTGGSSKTRSSRSPPCPLLLVPAIAWGDETLSAGEPGTLVSTGDAGALHRRLHEALSGKRGPGDVALRRGVARRSGADHPARRASIREGRPGTGARDAAARSRPVRSTRRRAVARQHAGRRAAAGVRCPDRRRHDGGKGVLDGSGEDRLRFLGNVKKTVSLFAESARAVRDGGHLVVVGPPETTGEGQLMPAALRQTVRTFLAEQHFLPAAKTVRASLLAGPGPGAERETEREVTEILEGTKPPGSRRCRWDTSGLDPLDEPLTQYRVGKPSLLLHRKMGEPLDEHAREDPRRFHPAGWGSPSCRCTRTGRGRTGSSSRAFAHRSIRSVWSIPVLFVTRSGCFDPRRVASPRAGREARSRPQGRPGPTRRRDPASRSGRGPACVRRRSVPSPPAGRR